MSDERLFRLPRPNFDLRRLDEVHQLVLRAAAKGNDPVLAELAREVRSGRMTMLEAAQSSAYREALAEGADKLVRSAEHLRPGDISAAVDEHALDRLAADLSEWVEQVDDATPAAQAPRPPSNAETDDEYFTDRAIMTSPATERSAETGPPPQRARWTRRGR